MDKPLVSVVMLSYNNMNCIKKALITALSQDYDNYEIIVSDDHSKDFDANYINGIIDDISKAKCRIIVSSNDSNLGTVANFNYALSLCKGDIIVPLACDDYFMDGNVISDIVAYFNKTKCLLCTALRQGAVSGEILPHKDDVDILTKANNEELLKRLYIENFISGSTMYYSKEILNRMGGFDRRYKYLEDYPFVLKVVQRGINIGFMDRVTICYGEKGISSRNRPPQSPTLVKDYGIINKDIIKGLYLVNDDKCKKIMNYRELRKDLSTHKSIINFFKLFNYIDIMSTNYYYRISKTRKEGKSIYYLYYKKELHLARKKHNKKY